MLLPLRQFCSSEQGHLLRLAWLCISTFRRSRSIHCVRTRGSFRSTRPSPARVCNKQSNLPMTWRNSFWLWTWLSLLHISVVCKQQRSLLKNLMLWCCWIKNWEKFWGLTCLKLDRQRWSGLGKAPRAFAKLSASRQVGPWARSRGGQRHWKMPVWDMPSDSWTTWDARGAPRRVVS